MRIADFRYCVLVSLLVTVPLVVLFFMGDAVAGLPLVTFDMFDWAVRVLPGPVVTFGIDAMVAVLNAFGVSVADGAKTGEQLFAFVAHIIVGTITGSICVVILHKLRWRMNVMWLGLFLGVALGLLTAFISRITNVTASTNSYLNGLWILATHIAWALSITWLSDKPFPSTSTKVLQEKPDLDRSTATQETTVEVLSRREFLVRVGAASASITVVGAGLSVAASLRGVRERSQSGSVLPLTPDGRLRDPEAENLLTELFSTNAFDGLVPGVRPPYTPIDEHYRIDINARPPTVDIATWRLSVVGMVKQPVDLTLNNLEGKFKPVHQLVTLSCISNQLGGDLISTTLWTGVSLQEVLDDVGILPGATHIYMTSSDGFHETLALDLIYSDPRIMLTYAWDGMPLKPEHGFPLRIYIPDRYGMKQPKWLRGIEVLDVERRGYWVVRGWDEDAIMRTTSVIDSVAVRAVHDQPPLVPIGGIAHAGARGISKVEVQVDGGGWIQAELHDPLSSTTWRMWRYDWPFQEGEHTFEVRSYDANGDLQIMESNGPRPSGATGIHSLTTTI